jgi:hypothetical protein
MNMNAVNNFLEKIFKFLASLRLAIIVMAGIAIIAGTGTILEARYDAAYAQKMVYQSPYMYFIMTLLCVNLFNVMIDRLPWKAHHTAFILVHIGIITLIIGALITRVFGVDGSLSFDIGQKNRYVMMPETELVVYATFGEGGYRNIYASQVDFMLHPPQKKSYDVQLGDKVLKVKDFYNWALREEKVVESTSIHDGPAIRVQMQNANVNLTQWLNRPQENPYAYFDLGPARIVLAEKKAKYEYGGGNEIVIRPASEKEGDTELTYEIYTKSKGGKTKTGRLPLAEAIDTGWMGLQLRLLKYLPHSEQKVQYVKRDHPTGLTVPAVLVEFDGHENWIGLNSNVRLFTDVSMYLVSYRNRLLDLGFDIMLDNFSVGRYQGTRNAMSYESVVTVPGIDHRKISMNEPLKYRGYTFYQASFQENPNGEPTTSVLSVNRDPGRIVKYAGALIMIFGTIMIFYFKQYRLIIFGSKREESP